VHIKAGYTCAGACRVLYEIDVFDVRLIIHGLTQTHAGAALIVLLHLRSHTFRAVPATILACWKTLGHL
jgi:hypothetical protein